MTEALSAYLATLADRPRQRQAATDWLGVFARYCQRQGLDWRHLERADLEDYRRTLRWEPGRSGRLYAPATVIQAMSQLRHFLRWAQRTGWLTHDPSLGLVVGLAPKSTRLLTPAQLVELLTAPDPSRPMGQRDALLLELVMTLEFGLTRTLALDLADVPRLPARERLQRYLREGRPALAQDPRETALLLTQTGGRLVAGRAMQLATQYARPLGLETPISTRLLARSFRAHQAAFSQGLFSL